LRKRDYIMLNKNKNINIMLCDFIEKTNSIEGRNLIELRGANCQEDFR
jgi:hypothetical protein